MGSIQTAEMRGARQGEEPHACAREVDAVNTARAKGRRLGRRNEKVSGRDVARRKSDDDDQKQKRFERKISE